MISQRLAQIRLATFVLVPKVFSVEFDAAKQAQSNTMQHLKN